MQAIFKNKLVIGGAVALILLFGGYFAIKGSGGSSASTSSGGVKKQAVAPSSSSNTPASGSGQEFATQLLTIQNITLNLDLFNDPVFKSLQDFSQEINDQPISRPNPFAPIDLKAIYDASSENADDAAVGEDTVPPKSFTPSGSAPKSSTAKPTGGTQAAPKTSAGGDTALFRALP